MTDTPGPPNADRPDSDGSVQDDKFAVKISVTPDTVTELLRRFDLDVGDRPHVEQTTETRGALYAFAPHEQIREMEAAGYTIEVGENVSETGRQRMAEVSEGDRFDGGRVPPRGLGRKPGRHDDGQGRESRKDGRAR
ncbi:hypothetical protein ACFPJ1_19545 [Kribbella qitaiheensis]|uniref:hypothetical protein n=1 Tax=Kribbella qitaiheensis TaxID=1544730 RepID=UPI003613AB34